MGTNAQCCSHRNVKKLSQLNLLMTQSESFKTPSAVSFYSSVVGLLKHEADVDAGEICITERGAATHITVMTWF